MKNELSYIGHINDKSNDHKKGNGVLNQDFVLEKSIFNNIFEKDIRRVFIYKKAERLAKALHLIAPAFTHSVSLSARIDTLSVSVVDAALLPPNAIRATLSRELLTLSSILSIGRTNGMLSAMNADLIMREVQFLLQEIALYEAPRVVLDEVPTLSTLSKTTHIFDEQLRPRSSGYTRKSAPEYKGHLKDNISVKKDNIERHDAILSFIKDRGRVGIKDISNVIRGVSEKTIQRELSTLISKGVLVKQGQRRWSIYSLA